MAGYFSNHSQSRFLSNSTNNTTSGTTTMTSTTPAAGRPRIPASRHFSTSVSTSSSGDEKEKLAGNREAVSANGFGKSEPHPLRHTWVFYFRQHRAPGQKIAEHEYEEGIKKISTVSSIESFWSLSTHLNTPSELQPTTDYLFFHSGVRRPVWEDPLNLQGGKWILRLKKGVADRLWEELIMAIVGDQFDDCGPSNSENDSWRSSGNAGDETDSSSGANGTQSDNDPEICGCSLSVRQHEDILSVWNKHGSDPRVNERIKDTLSRVLRLPENTSIIYKTNNESMQDKSSFRNPQPLRTPLA